jgi:hypothetical protein
MMRHGRPLSVVELLQSLLSIRGGIVVDVGISERTTSDGVAADTNGCDWADLREELEKHSLGDGGVKLSNVERSRSLWMWSSGAWSWAGIVSVFTTSVGDVGINGRGALCLTSIQGGVVEVLGELFDGGRHVG